MSDKFDNLIIEGFKSLKADIKSVDTKVEEMQKVHIKNTATLEEHERRSTASEKRIEILEDRAQKDALAKAKLKGFFLYGSLILTSIGGLVYFLLNLTDLLKNLGH